MERALGIGGYFIRSAEPVALIAWYRDHLGLDLDANGLWAPQAGPTVVAAMESGTDYLGSPAQQTMLNLRVADLDAMLRQLRDLGDELPAEAQDHPGIGRFAWVIDPDGNRVELWQPEPAAE